MITGPNAVLIKSGTESLVAGRRIEHRSCELMSFVAQAEPARSGLGAWFDPTRPAAFCEWSLDLGKAGILSQVSSVTGPLDNDNRNRRLLRTDKQIADERRFVRSIHELPLFVCQFAVVRKNL